MISLMLPGPVLLLLPSSGFWIRVGIRLLRADGTIIGSHRFFEHWLYLASLWICSPEWKWFSLCVSYRYLHLFSASWLSQFIPGRKHPKSPNWTEMPFLRLRFNVSIKASSTNFTAPLGTIPTLVISSHKSLKSTVLVITFCATYFSALVLSKPNVLF